MCVCVCWLHTEALAKIGLFVDEHFGRHYISKRHEHLQNVLVPELLRQVIDEKVCPFWSYKHNAQHIHIVIFFSRRIGIIHETKQLCVFLLAEKQRRSIVMECWNNSGNTTILYVLHKKRQWISAFPSEISLLWLLQNVLWRKNTMLCNHKVGVWLFVSPDFSRPKTDRKRLCSHYCCLFKSSARGMWNENSYFKDLVRTRSSVHTPVLWETKTKILLQ